MTDIVERARLVQRVNAHWLDSICDCDECTEERFDLITPMADEIEALRARLAHAEACLAEKHLRLAEVEALLKRAVECLGDNDDEDVLARAINKLLYSERHINADSASVTQEKNP